jgi:YVTN family beta-propeller protein
VLNRGKIPATGRLRTGARLELKVFLAGRIAVEGDGVLIDEERFPGRQGRLLFAYLVAEQGRPVPRDELAEALWGETPPATWEKALTVVASRLRALLAEHGVDGANALTGAFGCYRLNLPEGTWVDIVAAAEGSREAEAALAADDLENAKALATRAESLARSPFLPGEEGAWIDGKRRELADVLRRALGVLSDVARRSGDEADAAKWAEELIALEPYREKGYRALMAAHAAAGNRAEALRVYERCRRLLSDELGAYPSPETEAIYRQLLQAPPLEPRAAAAAPTPDGVAVEPGAPAVAGRARPRGRPVVLVALGFALLLAAAIAGAVIELTGSGRTLGSATANSAALIDSRGLVADVPVGNGPTSIAVGDGAVWVANAHGDSVTRIDPRTRSVVDHIPVGSAPSGIAFGAGAIWVTNSLEGTVARIDPETNTVVHEIPVGATPSAVAVDVDRQEVWVTSAQGRSVTRIDAASGRKIGRFPTGATGGGIAVGGGGIWITDDSSASVVRLDPVSGSVVATVGVGNGPTGIAFGAGSVWVANSLDGTVSRIDPETNTVTALIGVGEGPAGIAAARDAVWVSSEFTQEIARIDPAQDRVVERIPVGNRPKGLALWGKQVWFAVQHSGAGHRGGRLVVVPPFADSTIDPAFGWPPLLEMLYDPLVSAARRGGSERTRIVPNLAVSLPIVTAGGTTYAFQLRHGIRYSNGAAVKASDFRRAIERLFRAGALSASEYGSLFGADVCERRPRRCDLSQGVRTDDGSGTIVFHLRRPDGELLFSLSGLTPVPAGTPDRDVGTRAVPSTGPYRIERFLPGRTLEFVRNPHFRVWSKTARPDGYPDEIEFRMRLSAQSGSTGRAVTAVQRGRVDVAMSVPANRLQELETRYASQLHLNPVPGTHFILLNTKLPPFADIRVRRALNFAVDRTAVVRAQGGPEAGRPTCQLRPPSIAGYQPYCPYTIDPTATGEWKAPDLQRARRLVAASGTAGMKVTIWTMPSRAAATREVVAALKRLGYRAHVRVVATQTTSYFHKVRDRKTRWQAAMYGLISPWASPPSSYLKYLTCGATSWNLGSFCNRRIDARIKRALRIQASDPDASVRLWVRIERELVDQAPWVALYTPTWAEFVSKRVGNYQGSGLLEQLWVR